MSINDWRVEVMPVRLRAKTRSRVSAALSSRDVGEQPDCDSYPNLLRSTTGVGHAPFFQ